MEKRLYRSKRNKVFAGVCGGIAEYLNVNATFVRIVCAVIGIISLEFFGGIIAYVAAVFFIPQGGEYDPYYDNDGNDVFEDKNFDKGHSPLFDPDKSKNVIGGTLIVLGALFLIKQFFHWFDLRIILALAFIAGGVYMITRGRRL